MAVNTQLQVRRGSASQWTSANPTLAAGEFGFESDTGKFKIGTGSTAWTSLVYASLLSSEIPELSQDAIDSALTAGTGITKTYNDSANTLTLAVDTATIQARVTDVSDTEIGYLNGVTSAIQTQMDLKAPLAAPALTGDATAVNLTVSGNLTVNGTTTNINSTNLVVEDKNIVLGDAETPTDTTADGGGITLKGATDKTFNWVDATDAWTSSEHINLASGKAIYLNGTAETAATQTLTNKTIALGSNTVSGTLAQFNTAVTDADLASLAGTETLTNKTLTSPVINTPTGITKTDVGLANVDNTTDANKPVSTATQTALDLKANLSGPTFTGTVVLPSNTVTNDMLAGSIANNKLANSSVTINGSAVSLGGSTTIQAGPDEIAVIMGALI